MEAITKEVFSSRADKEAKTRPLVKHLDCPCGNSIDMYIPKDECKCFRCNHLWLRLSNGWERTNVVIERDDLTLGDIRTYRRVMVV